MFGLRGGKVWHKIYYFASSARAMIPAAMGAEAEVPECEVVHRLSVSVVACKRNNL